MQGDTVDQYDFMVSQDKADYSAYYSVALYL